MVRTKVDQATLFVIDVGRNVSTPVEKIQKSFFEKAREFSKRLIERMIISQGKNWVGVMLLGSKKTNNSLAAQCEGAYRHIDMVFGLGPPTWQMIRDMPEKPSSSKGDWVDALIVAAEHFKSVSGATITYKKIILLTNFQTPTTNTSMDVELILDGFKNDDYEVDIIGPNLDDNTLKGIDIEFARQFVKSTDGQTANFEYAMQYLSFHRKRAAKSVPWNVDLSIGPNIKIPVSAYVRLKDEPVVKSWVVSVKDPVTLTASTTEAVIKSTVHMNTENQLVEQDEVIKGYHYGQKVIPFSSCDKTMLYMSGDKCLSVYGFTNYSDINWQVLNGDALFYVFGRKGDKKAQNAIRCLVECLHETKLVGIVRRVYNKNNAPKMYALFPVIDTDNYLCLSMAAVCFKEDIKYMSFPSTNLKKYACNDAQVSAFKDLIKAMDLTRAYNDTYDDEEAFPIAKTFSPFAQYILDCIAFRALNPGKALPKPRDDIMNLFKVPPQVAARAEKPLEKLKSLLVLNKVEKKRRKKKTILNDDAMFDAAMITDDIPQGNEMPKILLPQKADTNDGVVRISTVDPISDFTKLKSKGKKLEDLFPEMTSAIEDLMYCNVDGDYKRAFDTMSFLRKECVDTDPSHYNNWLQKFKAALNDRKKSDVIDLISQRNVNFILKSENSLSTFERENSHDESQMYENDTIPNTAELTIQSELNDFFDEF